MIGQLVDHFKILSKLGTDVRNDVWEAEDTRIGRRVAINFLHKKLAQNRIAVERFRRESELASQLSHPNLCTILDVGTFDQRPYVVMELLDGQSLKDVLQTGRPSLSRALAWLQQLAEALDSMHSHSMLHRDLNPSNIFVTSRNQIKIHDIGLGRLMQSNAPPHYADLLPHSINNDDAELRITNSGQFTPSVHYLSPEQLRGLRPDQRSDLFSLGVVAYELITGVRPFAGDTRELIGHNILNGTITPPSTINPYIGEKLEQLILRLLEQDRDLRCQNATELLIDLQSIEVDRHTSLSLTIPAAVQQLRRKTYLFRGLVAIAVILALVGAILLPPIDRRSEPTNNTPSITQSSNTPPNVVPLSSAEGRDTYPVLSPLGNQVAYSDGENSSEDRDIYVRILEADRPLRITKHKGRDLHPCWSPDGNKIGFIRRNGEQTQIVITSAIGGTERVIYSTDSLILGGLDWSPDGEHIAFDMPTENGAVIALVNPVSYEVEQVTDSNTAFLRDDNPAFSPDGKWLAFVRTLQGIESNIILKELQSGEEEQITFDNKPIRGIDWTPDSRELIYSSSRNGPFMIWRHRLGSSTPQLVGGAGLNATHPSTSFTTNSLVHTVVRKQVDLVRVNLHRGNANTLRPTQAIPSSTSLDYAPKISPNGKLLAYISERTGFPELWVAKADGSNARQVTSLSHHNIYMPTWSADSQYLLFRSQHLGYRDMYYVAATGGRVHDATGPDFKANSAFWSKESRVIYARTGGDSPSIYRYEIQTGKKTLVTDDGGTATWDHPNNENIFIAKFQRGRPRIYEMEPNGTQSPLDPKVHFSRSYAIDIRSEGIYFVRTNTSQPEYMSLYIYRFDTQDSEKLATEPIARWDNFGFSISPDAQWFYYGKQIKDETDMIILENYR